MTFDRKIGQLLFCGWQGPPAGSARGYGAHARRLIENLHAGGIILMGRNLAGPGKEPEAEAVAVMVNRLQEMAEVPLWVGTDQEGGAVARFTNPGLTFPGNMALAATGSEQLVTTAAAAIAEQLASMGINVDFAPVLDVNNNPANPIIGTRSFGEDPGEVARLGLAAIEGFSRSGVMPVAKHFPGHGDTGVDSHLDLPVQKAGRGRLDDVELVPFKAAIQGGIPSIMTTHILFPALDAELPATLSRPILTGLLREDLGFEGLIVTDCMEMQAIADRWGPEEAAVLAVEAGADMLLVCHTLETQQRMRDALRAAVKSGRLPGERIEASAERILKAKQNAGLSDRRRVDPDKATATVGAEQFRERERQVARAALTTVHDSGQLPIPSDAAVQIWGPTAPTAALGALLRGRGIHVIRTNGHVPPPAERILLLLDRTEAGSLRPSTLREVQTHPNLIVVALREPYALARFPAAACRVACYSGRACSLEALADLLVGRARATGKLPVSLS